MGPDADVLQTQRSQAPDPTVDPRNWSAVLKWLERLNLADAATDTAPPTVHDASVANALGWAVQTVVADGVTSDEENRAILQLAARQGLTMVADVAVADGTVDDAEMKVLLDLGQHVGMARYDVKLLLAKSQARQRREA